VKHPPNAHVEALRATYETALAIHQDYVAAVALAHSDEAGVSKTLLNQLARAAHVLRIARRRYHDALMGSSPSAG
jgi:hypothetical protein